MFTCEKIYCTNTLPKLYRECILKIYSVMNTDVSGNYDSKRNVPVFIQHVLAYFHLTGACISFATTGISLYDNGNNFYIT
jgi:hypothetical protein